MFKSQIDICQCLSFNSLSSIYHKDGSVTGRKASGNLIVKIHMSRRIDQVKNIFFSVLCFINNPDCLRLNSNPSFSFQIHIVQDLRLHFSLCQKSGLLNNTVGKCGLAMVYMCNNAEITNLALICHSAAFLLLSQCIFVISCPIIAYPPSSSPVISPAFQGLSQSYMLFIFLLSLYKHTFIFSRPIFFIPSTKLKCIFKSQPAKVNTISVNEQIKKAHKIFSVLPLQDIQIKFKICLCPHTVDFIVQNSVLSHLQFHITHKSL